MSQPRAEPADIEEVVAEGVVYFKRGGFVLVWQHGRAQIVRLVGVEDITYELESALRRRHAVESELKRAYRTYDYALRRFRSELARLAAMVRAFRIRLRIYDLWSLAIRAGRYPTPLVRLVARIIGRPRVWVRTHPEEALEELLRAIDEYERRVRRQREVFEEARREYRTARENIEKLRRMLEDLEVEIENLRRLLRERRPMKLVYEDYVEHIKIELTYAVETGGERTGSRVHQALVMEVHAYTEVQPMEMLHKDMLEDIIAKMDVAVRNFIETLLASYSVSGGAPPPDAIIKKGVRYIYEEKEHEISWPNILVVTESAQISPIVYFAALHHAVIHGVTVKDILGITGYTDKYLIRYVSYPPYYEVVT